MTEHGPIGMPDLMDQLRAVARRTLAAAGPRYSPAVDPDAPNLEIRTLQRAAFALSLGAGFEARTRDLRTSLHAAYSRDQYAVDQWFSRRTVNLQRLVDDLDCFAGAGAPSQVRRESLGLRRHLKLVRERVAAAEDQVYADLEAFSRTAPSVKPDDSGSARTRRRERLQGQLSMLRRLDDPLREMTEFVDGPEGELLTRCNSILLLGEWGTGKTHFLCDFALQALRDSCPTVVVLASSLRTDLKPLDAVAQYTGLAASGTDLVRLLESAASARGRRALVLIDAVNESDRASWRMWLPQLVREVGKAEHLGLVVSCRTPFDEGVVTQGARKNMVQLRHPGFEDQEFDAQIEFFKHYRLPALHVPLLTAEFSRPLFLRLMCEGIKNLGKRSQKNKLKDIASGQKSMTYVLENFVKRVGAEVEAAHGLPAGACWLIIKGAPRNRRPGLAGILASNRREWMSLDEAVDEVQAFARVTWDEAGAIIASMKAAGLLIEHSRYDGTAYIDVLLLPYQRFSDHLVARHLLDEHLDTSSQAAVRRCFYANRRLGAVFVADRWGQQYAEPGIASALMIEFPERVKRLGATGVARAELLGYLPKKRLLVRPFVDAFLEGLYWRSTAGLSSDTERLLLLLLDCHGPDIRARTYEVLFGLAARDDGPLGSLWLHKRLCAMSMPQRDVEWSEFLRTASSDANVHRLLAWVEREQHATVETAVAVRTLRLLTLLLTTTDRLLRDRATRALVLLGEAHTQPLFDIAVESLAFNDPYVPERTLAAAYGVCMRRMAKQTGQPAFASAVATLGRRLLELVLRPSAPFATWHTLMRGYAIGVLQVLAQLRPQTLARADRQLLALAPGQAPSPFRPASQINKEDVDDAERAIRTDFGNYTLGRLVRDRRNYDFQHPEYANVRRQITDRMRQLGHSTKQFGEVDRRIVQHMEYRRDGHKVDRYGKKYSWIAFFEMYGLRRATGELDELRQGYPRTSDCDIDPSFPNLIPDWVPPHRSIFETSPVEIHSWIADGEEPGYESLLRQERVDGLSGDWILLDAAIHEGVEDGRELRAWVTSILVPERSIARLHEEVDAGRDLSDNGFPQLGADHYTYHGEIPWCLTYGSDVRTKRGVPKRTSDRAFDYFDSARKAWKTGIQVEATCRRWEWESHHSALNQVGSLVFPAPPIATALGLRIAGGVSDMLDRHGAAATIYRQAPGPGYGSYFLYMRHDLVTEYADSRGLRLVQMVAGERSISYRSMEHGLQDLVQRLLEAGVHRFGRVVGLGAETSAI